MGFYTKVLYSFAYMAKELGIYSVYYVLYTLISVYYTAMDTFSHNKAQLGTIMWKRRISFIHNSIPMDFLCLKYTSVEPEYVLRSNVSLYSVTYKEAVFIETPAETNIYSSETFPFFFSAQFIYGTRVIKMPIECFHTLAEKIGDPKIPVSLIFNTGRCGSTILGQVFESVPGTLVMAEPDAVQNVFYLFRYSEISENEYLRILRSTVRLLCKPCPGIDRIIMKLRSSCTALMPDIRMLFPAIHQVFLYRNCQDTLLSFVSALDSYPYGLILNYCSNSRTLSIFLPIFKQMLRLHIATGKRGTPEVPLNVNSIGILSYLWAEQIKIARDSLSRDPDILPIRYEDIVSRQTETISILFEKTGIDLMHLNNAVSTLSRDSHRGIVLSQSQRKTKPKLDIADRVTIDSILASYNLPAIDSDFRLCGKENTNG